MTTTPDPSKAPAAGAAPASRPTGWWRDAVVYQVYPRSFADSNGDGIGDIAGITARLDYLHHLGVDVVWLSPVYVSPQDDNGYDISDYTDIDPAFGTLADLDQLITGLHKRGMKVVMDLVVNHTSDEHPWFTESRDPDSPKRDWYWWRPARDGFEPGAEGAEPTNWESAFSGPAWHYDAQSGEYYLHLFSRKQPDLNWENPEVRQAIHAMMNWWVARGVDGFRMDVINFISKPAELTDGPVPQGQRYSDAFAVVADGHRMHEFLAEMNAAVLAGQNLITVGEMPEVTVEEARRYTDPARAELDMVFTFEHVNLDQYDTKWDLAGLSLPVLKANLAVWQDGLAEVGWNSLYWNNHDQPRTLSRFGDDAPEHRVNSAKTLGTVLHLLKGTPYVYQGEELGMTNAGFTAIEEYRDIEALNHHAAALARGLEESTVLHSLSVKGRDNARTPMHWDATRQAGFTTGEAWLSPLANRTEINAEAAVADPDSVFHHYRQLIALRHTSATVVDGVFALLLPDHEQLFVYTRTLGDDVLWVVANCSSEPATLPADLALPADATLALGTHADPDPAVLQPWESRILRASHNAG